MADIRRIHPEREPVREPPPLRHQAAAPLWREALGHNLRAVREEQESRLVDVAERAGISPQYLSEIERGRKEPSSEMIAAVTGALGIELHGLLTEIAASLQAVSTPKSRPAVPVLMAA